MTDTLIYVIVILAASALFVSVLNDANARRDRFKE